MAADVSALAQRVSRGLLHSLYDPSDQPMARLPRLILPGYPHLLTQEKATGGSSLFADDEDRRLYLAALLESSRACAVNLHAYSLLDDRAMLLATPPSAEAIGRFMQRVGRRYVGEFNRRHGRGGALWAGRYRASLVEPGAARVLDGMRFVEQAPQRAGLVADAAAWPWSSAAQHLGRARGSLITSHPAYWQLGNTPFAREAAYSRQLEEPLADRDVASIEAALRGGWPIGSSAFCATLASAVSRPVRPGVRGRPRGAAVGRE